ncbi:hypothetical protein K490DRAFT_74899 [Saccharata proteae CBS 121410]|uniref:Uncharacterized protein n=1 Tax=Saccharata proteae CBS 121410 TaxID=1314787 RepID=A0A9P4LV91_9PEZI|nr:hypothetical protein K490DRAFT_74899 [Saccharata proteae CBS 121410]
MFCLRSWIPILFFLTNASPVYLVLFISATYFLNRPCVYCSLLLAILVFALFDFHTSWFDPNTRYHPEASDGSNPSSNATIAHEFALDSASLVASAFSDTAGAVKAQISSGADWGKMAFIKKEWKLPCLDVVVRL